MPASVPASSVTGGVEDDPQATAQGRLATGEGVGEGHLQQVEQGQGQGQLEAPTHREANAGSAAEQLQYASSEAGQGTTLSYR